MAQEVLRILGQARPAINTEVVVYSVPENRRAAISLIAVVNNGGTNAAIDLNIVPGGSNNLGGVATQPVNKILDGFTLNAGKANTEAGSLGGKGVTLNEYDDIRFETDQADVVIHVYGVEVLPEKD